MDGHDYHCSSELDSFEPEELGIAPSPPSTGSAGSTAAKPRHPAVDAGAASSPSAKRSRRSVQKQVVTIPISETKGGAGEGAPPPSDSWAWRKYGQKPIKGSPYPRGYYRCSSSKGCPARKQVERSRVDPSMIVVTYSFDHNHPWPISKNYHHHKCLEAAPLAPVEEQPPLPTLDKQQHLLTTESTHPESAVRYEKFSDAVGDDESSLLVPSCDFNWFPDVGSPVSASPAGSDERLFGSAFFGGPDTTVANGFNSHEREESASAGDGGGGICEDDALFAGLDELPEYSVVFRRGAASAAWMGTTTTTSG